MLLGESQLSNPNDHKRCSLSETGVTMFYRLKILCSPWEHLEAYSEMKLGKC